MTDKQKDNLRQVTLVVVTAVASAFASYNGSTTATELTLDQKVERVEFVREIGRLERLISDERTYRGVIVETLAEMKAELRTLNDRLSR